MFSADTIEFLFYMGFEDFDAQAQEFPYLDEDDVVDVLAQIEMFEMGGHPDQEGLSREIGYDAIDGIRDELEDWVYENRKVHHRGGVSKANKSVEDVQALVARHIALIRALSSDDWLDLRPYSEDIIDEEYDLYYNFTDMVWSALEDLKMDLEQWPDLSAATMREDFMAGISDVDDISEDFPPLQMVDSVLNALDELHQIGGYSDVQTRRRDVSKAVGPGFDEDAAENAMEEYLSLIDNLEEAKWMWDQGDDPEEDPHLYYLITDDGREIRSADEVQDLIDKAWEAAQAHRAGNYEEADDLLMEADGLAAKHKLEFLYEDLREAGSRYEHAIDRQYGKRKRSVTKAIDSVEDVEAVVEAQIERVRAANVYGWMEGRPFSEDISEDEIDYYIDFKDSVFNAFRALESDLAAGEWPERSAWTLQEELIDSLVGDPNEISEDFPALQALDVVMNAIDGLERLESQMNDYDEDY